MAKSKSDGKVLSESPVTDLFEAGRHPSESEKQWAEKTLAPTLEKNPEKPIGAPTGIQSRRRGRGALHHDFRHADPPPIHAGRSARGLEPRHLSQLSRTSAVYTRYPRFRLPRQNVDHAPVFGLRFSRGDECALQYLLAHGGQGLSVAFDLPTLMGYDSDHPFSEGEVGKCGVAIDSLEDMEILFDGIDLEKTTVSMTINSPASILWAMYLAVAEKQGADWKKISGTMQNDILKEYIAQKEYIYPPAPSMRLVIDTFEFGSKFIPRFNTISISGYHIREAGSTALQELAFTIYDGVEYVEWARRRGLDVDEFGPRLSFFFNAHNDFFEEIAKYRAARKIWYRLMKDRFGAKNQRSGCCASIRRRRASR